MQQTSFDFPLSYDYASSDFILSDANRAAYTWVTAWPEWSSYGLVIYGPPDCGKTHLAHIWQEKTGAAIIQASSLNERDLPVLLQQKTCYIIENIDRIAEESAFFHLLNHSKNSGGYVLITSLKVPNQLSFSLPDLCSRINALPSVAIDLPDDNLLRAVLHKQFAERQVRIQEDAIEFLLARMERSFAMAKHIVSTLDRIALQERAKITIPFIKRTLGLQG